MFVIIVKWENDDITVVMTDCYNIRKEVDN